MFDLVVHGGMVLDGTGSAAARADIGVAAGRIAAVGDLDAATATDRIDATGRLVLPGLVDAHSHADAAILAPVVQLATLRQGVTTVVLGQDGLSYAPADLATRAFVERYFAAINGHHPALDGTVSVADLMATWRGTTAVNTAYLVPHGTLRFGAVGGSARGAGPEEIAAMRRGVERGLEDGAVGLSSGLEYVPGRFADAAELVELCRPVAAAGLPYVTHTRGYGEAAPRAFAEAQAIGRAAGVAVHISHLHGPGQLLVGLVDDALRAGIDVSFDTYPYRRACTILAMAALPRWLDSADLDAETAALADPAVRARVVAGLSPDLLGRITLAHVPHPDWRWTEGRRLTDAAQQAGRPAVDVLVDLLVATGLAASGVVERPPATGADAIPMLLRHPAHVGGSDGIYVGSHPHPRGWGTFARFLGRHVRERADWTWPEAAVHLAAHPAHRFGLADRGRVRPGLAADLAMVDADRVRDAADYANPTRPATGVQDVVVNGVPVLRAGELTGALAGRPLAPAPRP